MATTLTPRAQRQSPLSSVFDEMFRDFFAPSTESAQRATLPPMNVAETRDAYVLSFELPGVVQEDIDVQVEDGQLVVQAERKFESEKTEGTDFHRVEHRYGSFTRSLSLPREVRADAIEASFKNGVLTVTVPKSEPTVAKRVEIKTD